MLSLLLCLAPQSEAYSAYQAFESPSANTVDEFGASSGLDGDLLAIGAPFDQPAGMSAYSGSVFTYERTPGGDWTVDQALTHPSGSASSYFGNDLALEDSSLLIGARGAGAAYLYERSGDTWHLESTLHSSSSSTNFPRRVKLGSDFAVASHPAADESRGIVCVYNLPVGTSSAPSASLTAPVALDSLDRFGFDVAVSDTGNLAVGCPGKEAVYVYTRSSSSFVHTRTITLPGLGRSVSWAGDLLLAGAPFTDGSVNGNGTSGAVHVFTLDGLQIDSFGHEGYMMLGRQIEATSGHAYVTANIMSSLENRRVLHFEQIPGLGWTFRGFFQPSEPGATRGLAVDGDELVLGSTHSSSGSAGAYMREDIFEGYCTSTPNSTGQPGSLAAIGSRSSTSTMTLVGANLPQGVAWFFDGPRDTQFPFGNGFLCVSGPYTRIAPRIVNASGSAATTLNGMPAGTTRCFQVFYQDPTAGGAGFNLTSAVRVVFTP